MIKVKLRQGKFGMYFEQGTTALTNQEVLKRLNQLVKIEAAVIGVKLKEPKPVKKAPKKWKATKTGMLKAPPMPRTPNQDFMTKMIPSPTLAAVIGNKALTRSGVVVKIWDYIKKNNLQNPKNKRNILCDEKLEKLFLKKEITIFEMADLVNKH